MDEKDSIKNLRISIFIPALILERIFNLLKNKENTDIPSALNSAINLWFERKTELLKYQWERRLNHMVLNKKNVITLGEPIEFNFACMPTVYPEGLRYEGIGKINVPEGLNNSVKASFLKLNEEKNKITALLTPIKTFNALKLFFEKYINYFKNGEINENYYNLGKHLKVFSEYIKQREVAGWQIGHLEFNPSILIDTIFRIENLADDCLKDFKEFIWPNYKFIEFLILMQEEEKLKIKEFKTKLSNHPVYDSWKMIIDYKQQNNKIREEGNDTHSKSNNNKKYILRYYEINKSFVLDKKNLKLTPTESSILFLICSSPNKIQRPVKNNIRTHCCNINKKSKIIIKNELITSSSNINNFSVVVKGID